MKSKTESNPSKRSTRERAAIARGPERIVEVELRRLDAMAIILERSLANLMDFQRSMSGRIRELEVMLRDMGYDDPWQLPRPTRAARKMLGLDRPASEESNSALAQARRSKRSMKQRRKSS